MLEITTKVRDVWMCIAVFFGKYLPIVKRGQQKERPPVGLILQILKAPLGQRFHCLPGSPHFKKLSVGSLLPERSAPQP